MAKVRITAEIDAGGERLVGTANIEWACKHSEELIDVIQAESGLDALEKMAGFLRTVEEILYQGATSPQYAETFDRMDVVWEEVQDAD